MHELAVCQSMLAQVANIAAQHHASAVAAIHVSVGPLSGVEPHLLNRAFPIASAGTVAAGAELVLETLAICVRCQSCGAESNAEPNRLLCAECGDWRTQLVSGDELLLTSVELTTETPRTS